VCVNRGRASAPAVGILELFGSNCESNTRRVLIGGTLKSKEGVSLIVSSSVDREIISKSKP